MRCGGDVRGEWSAACTPMHRCRCLRKATLIPRLYSGCFRNVQGCYAALLPAAKLGPGAEVGPLLNAVLRQFSGLVTSAADSEVLALAHIDVDSYT